MHDFDREEAKMDALRLGVFFVLVGLVIFLFGFQLKFEWLANHAYIQNAPATVLVSFVIIGVVLMYISKRLSNKPELRPDLNAELSL